jgi:hypothetical protein
MIHSDRTIDEDHQALQQLLLLALGRPIADGTLDWATLYQLAEAERIAALAWHRSGEVIRCLAPPAIVNQWRAHAMRVALQVETLVDVVAQAVEALRRSAIEPVVLKGAPLAQRLYGDATVRPLADCDVYIPLAQRAAARDVLAAEKWTSRVGEPPSEETFERWGGGQRNVIEVHSSILDDSLLSYTHIPVEKSEVAVGEATLPTQSGDYVPVSLAAHLAKHETAPLLWVVDFHTLWESLDDASRHAAQAAATRVGLHRHLHWACELASRLEDGAGGSTSALTRLASLHRTVGDLGRVRRLIGLSATPLDALRIVAGRVWPSEWRDDWKRAPNYLLQRGSRWIARRARLIGHGNVSTGHGHVLSVDDEELASLLEETLGRGLAVWIRPRGSSMEPAIPSSAAAHIEPVSPRGVRQNDVVLARLPHGHFVLHRVVQLTPDSVQLKGDAMRRRDIVVAPAAIIGVCDRIEIGGLEYPIESRPRDAVAVLTSAARARLRRLVSARGA